MAYNPTDPSQNNSEEDYVPPAGESVSRELSQNDFLNKRSRKNVDEETLEEVLLEDPGIDFEIDD